MAFDITGITTFCRNDEYVDICLGTLTDLYPWLRVIVVDNSPLDHVCAEKLRDIERQGKIELIANGKNLGHGPGLALALEEVKTSFVLMFDSDVEFINKDLLQDMMRQMGNGTYGTGFVMWHGVDGCPRRPFNLHEERPPNSLKYLHPFCALISMHEYKNYAPIDTFIESHNIAHGSPMTSPMEDIHRRGHEYKIKLLPGSHYTRSEYWNHTSGAVRIILRDLGMGK